MNIGAAAQLRGWGTPDSVSGNFFRASRGASGLLGPVGCRGRPGSVGGWRGASVAAWGRRLGAPAGEPGRRLPGAAVWAPGRKRVRQVRILRMRMRRIPAFLLYLYGRPDGAQSPAGVVGGILRCGVMASGPKKAFMRSACADRKV